MVCRFHSQSRFICDCNSEITRITSVLGPLTKKTLGGNRALHTQRSEKLSRMQLLLRGFLLQVNYPNRIIMISKNRTALLGSRRAPGTNFICYLKYPYLAHSGDTCDTRATVTDTYVHHVAQGIHRSTDLEQIVVSSN